MCLPLKDKPAKDHLNVKREHVNVGCPSPSGELGSFYRKFQFHSGNGTRVLNCLYGQFVKEQIVFFVSSVRNVETVELNIFAFRALM
jgi:hypothetical protein